MIEKEYEFFIPERLPGLNNYIEATRIHRQKGAKMKASTELIISCAIKNQLKGLVIKKPVFITYIWVEKNKSRDKDNVAFDKKFIQDALVSCGVLKNDGWKNITGFEDSFMVDKDKPGVRVCLTEVNII